VTKSRRAAFGGLLVAALDFPFLGAACSDGDRLAITPAPSDSRALRIPGFRGSRSANALILELRSAQRVIFRSLPEIEHAGAAEGLI
jgi:hypothetical protein